MTNDKSQMTNGKFRSEVAGGVRSDRGLPPLRRKRVVGVQLFAMACLVLATILLTNAFAQYPYGRATVVYEFAGTPVDGASGTLAKVARKGALLSDTTNGVLYQQTGTQAVPVWVNPIGIGTGAITAAKIGTGAVTSIKMADDLGHTVQVSLSAANIIAMGTTPVSLIAAPGASKIILVDSILLKMVRTATAFTGGGAVEFRYTDASGAKVSADIAASVVTTGGAGTEYNHVGGLVSSFTPVANAAIVIANADAAFAAGTGTAVVSISYRIVTP